MHAACTMPDGALVVPLFAACLLLLQATTAGATLRRQHWTALPLSTNSCSAQDGKLDRQGWAQVETGVPFMLYKDACNRKSNQQNLGTIRCSNLCTEIVEFTSPEETAVCNLASIALPRFVREQGGSRDRVRVVGSLDSSARCVVLEGL